MQYPEIADALEQFPTPLYVFRLPELRAIVNSFREACNENVRLCYAVKANPFIICEMAELVDRIEVCSMGEFRICRQNNIPAEKLLISGVLKKEEDLREIFKTYGGICQYTAESLLQYRMLEKLAEESGQTVRVFLRLSAGSQFGMDRTDLETILKKSGEHPLVRIRGIHYFSGTQKKSLKKVSKELEMLDRVYEELAADFGFQPEELEYGPGLAVHYFTSPGEDPVPARKELGELCRKKRWQGTVCLEMGRALCAECGTYLTKVLDVKTVAGRNFAIVDGGMHQLNYDGQIRGMYLPQLEIIPNRQGCGCQSEALSDGQNCGETTEVSAGDEWTVCGSLCTTNDVLLQNLPVKELKIGDVIAFHQTGAYSVTEGMALFLSHELPGVVTFDTIYGWKVLRSQTETFQWNTAVLQ